MRLLWVRVLRQEGQPHRAKGKVPYAYYRCVGTDAYRFGGTRVCHNKQVRTDRLDDAVWNDVQELLREPKLLREEYGQLLQLPAEDLLRREPIVRQLQLAAACRQPIDRRLCRRSARQAGI